MPDLLLVAWSLVIFGFGIAEYLRMDGNCFPFALGGLGGIVAWGLKMELLVQGAAFVVVSALAFLLLRPLYKRVLDDSTTKHAEGLDLLVGLEAKVIAKVGGDDDTGRVEINGIAAKAVPVDPQQKYNVGDRIVVTALDEDTLVVKKAKKR
jgi:membrane protein implicated in regulation of membrane protease activity